MRPHTRWVLESLIISLWHINSITVYSFSFQSVKRFSLGNTWLQWIWHYMWKSLLWVLMGAINLWVLLNALYLWIISSIMFDIDVNDHSLRLTVTLLRSVSNVIGLHVTLVEIIRTRCSINRHLYITINLCNAALNTNTVIFKQQWLSVTNSGRVEKNREKSSFMCSD